MQEYPKALYLRGWTQAQIAAEVGLSQGMISNDLKLIQKRWREEDRGEGRPVQRGCRGHRGAPGFPDE